MFKKLLSFFKKKKELPAPITPRDTADGAHHAWVNGKYVRVE